jgi:hypothetical protein
MEGRVPVPELIEKQVICPYCGEPIDVLVDDSVPDQRYVEDCQVCCRPIVLDVSLGPEGDAAVVTRQENE